MKKITLLIAFCLAFATESYAQFPQSFEGVTFPPTGWATFIGTNGLGTAQNWQRSTGYPNTGTASAFVRWDDSSAGSPKEDWLVTPQFTVAADATGLLFYQSQDYGTDYGTTYSIRVSTSSQTSHAAFTSVLEMTEADVPLEYGPRMVDLSAYIGQQIYVAFVMTNDNGDNWWIDDVNMVASVEAPGCASNPFPVDMATDVEVGTLTFTWDAPTTGGEVMSYDIFAGDTAEDVTTFVANVETNSIELNLNAYDTTIFWKVVAKNAGGDAVGCAAWSFTTQSPPGYCLNAPYGQFPGGEEGFTPDVCDGVTINEIADNAYAGEYSLVNVTAGETYTFVSGSSDFITIGNATSNNSYIAGATPVVWVAEITGQVRFYSHTDDQCGVADDNRLRGVICGVATADAPDYANLQWPPTMTIDQGQTGTVYGQVYEAGLTDVEPGLSGQAAGIQAWVGVSPENTDPETWTADSWMVADFNAASSGNNDEYMAEIGGGLTPGTYYYATRFRLNDGGYVYGGHNGSNGNFWNGTEFISGVLTVNAPPAPNNDVCSGAFALTPYADFASSAIETSNLGGTDDSALPSCQEVAGENVWYSVVIPDSGSITLETGESDGSLLDDTIITAYTGSCAGGLTEIGCNDDGGEGTFSLLALSGLDPGQTVYISVWRWTSEFSDGAAGNFMLAAYDSSLAAPSFDSNAFAFYPNPVKNVLNLSYNEKISDVEVFNLIGQKVLAVKPDTAQASVDMSAIASGTYMVKVTSDQQVKVVKVIKE